MTTTSNSLYPIEYGIPIPERRGEGSKGRAPSVLNLSIKAHLVKMRPSKELEKPDSFIIPKDKLAPTYDLKTKEGRSHAMTFITNVIKKYKKSLSQEEQNNTAFQIRLQFNDNKEPLFYRITRNP